MKHHDTGSNVDCGAEVAPYDENEVTTEWTEVTCSVCLKHRSTHQPATQWAASALLFEARMAEIQEELDAAKANWRAALALRCPKRPDSLGARCTNDAGHLLNCRYKPEIDWPEPMSLTEWAQVGWRADRWDLR